MSNGLDKYKKRPGITSLESLSLYSGILFKTLMTGWMVECFIFQKQYWWSIIDWLIDFLLFHDLWSWNRASTWKHKHLIISFYWVVVHTSSPTTHRGTVWKGGAEIPWEWSPEFESRHRHMWRVFHLWLPFITFGGRLAHLAYPVHKSGRKTPIVINI